MHDLKILFEAPATVLGHESRIRDLLSLFFESASRNLDRSSLSLEPVVGEQLGLTARGRIASEDIEFGKLFKFYYIDPAGNPDLTLATARLIAETYGGDLTATQDGERVEMTLTLPREER